MKLFFDQSHPNGQKIHAQKPKAYSNKTFGQKNKTTHKSEEGGAYLRISFMQLLMNLINKYLFKKLLKWANEKQNNFNIYNAAFKKKKGKHL